MLKDYQLTRHSLPEFNVYMQELLKEHPVILVTAKDADTGNWSMSKLWRAWMKTTADFMAFNGCTMPLYVDGNGVARGSRPFNPDDAHELFTSRWLGTDEEGKRLSWSRSGREDMRPATKGERYHALQRHEQWAIEKGIILINPLESEYRQMEAEQNR